MNKILTNQFLTDNREVFERFAEWYNKSNKVNTTKVTLKSFFDSLTFELQLGYYLEWFASNGVYIVSRVEPINGDLMLKLVYDKDANLEFKYHDIDEVNLSHFGNNKLEAYELLVATFIYKCSFPF